MARSRRSAVQKYHDRVAPRYDDSYGDAFWQWHNALTWDYLKPHLPRDQLAPVVDLGCGTGTWAARIAKSGFSVTCVDISPRMVDQTRAKLAELGGSKEHAFVQADLADLGNLPQGHFALAVAMGEPIGCARSAKQAMKQIRRVLAPGGVLVATFDNRLAALDFHLEKGDAQAATRFLRDGKTHWLTKDQDERFEITTFTPTDVVKLVESTGFEMLDLVGKTVLPMRRYRHLIETSEDRRTWAKIEKRLCRHPDAIGRAAHIQIACRRISN